MKKARWFALCFLLLHSRSSDGQKLRKQDTVSVFNAVEKLIPTLKSENAKCQEHSRLYLEELRNFKLWATEMFDSSTKFPSGILYGSSYDFGNFDQCLDVTVPHKSEPFTGKYCLAKFTVKPPSSVGVNQNIDYNLHDYRRYFNVSTWEKIAVFSKDESKGARNELFFSFCIPSSCTNKDLKESLIKMINDFNVNNDFEVDVNVNKQSCQVKNQVQTSEFTSGDIAFILIVCLFIMMVLMASVYDLVTQLEGLVNYKLPCKLHEIIVCFSFPSNYKKMTKYSTNEDGLDCLAGLKVWSMFLIIMGHRCMFTFGYPLINPKFVEEVYTKVEATPILNGPIIVDTFFTISGFLATYLTIVLFEKNKGRVNIIMIYVHRFVRMLPLYALVVAFYCTVFVKVGSGPLWLKKVGLEQARCMETWWANLLFINNYVNVDNLCMFQSWYLTCDLHYFLFVPLFVWLLRKYPKLGLVTLLAILFTSILTVFFVVYISNEDAILLLYIKLLKDPVLNKTFKNIYIRSHLRATPYLVGILAGYIRYKMKATNYKISKFVLYTGWILCVLLSTTTIHSAFIFYLPQVPRHSIFSALYASMHHFTHSVCIGWGIIAITTGNGPWIEPIVCWKPLKFLSKITYAAFLCHGAIQIYTASILRTPKYSSMFTIAYDTFGDITFAYIFGFILCIYFEAPVIGLEKIMFGRGEKPKSESPTQIISIPRIKSTSDT